MRIYPRAALLSRHGIDSRILQAGCDKSLFGQTLLSPGGRAFRFVADHLDS
jgi:hypothetical protein